jgi:amidase
MDYRVGCSTVIFSFSCSNTPVCKVPSGAQITIETMDCFANQLQTPEDTLDAMDWERVNPATGPIFVEGAHPGDVLKVEIKKIQISSQGVMATGENEGTLGAHMQGLTCKIIPIKDNQVIFDSKISIPLKPMIGVIGVAPREEKVNCGTPGSHGGNMDNTMIGEGATLYLPIFTEGALFALGDVHAVMGDGEIGVSGVEVPAQVTVALEVVKGLKLDNPVLENPEFFSTIASALTLDEAIHQATNDMAQILASRIKLSFPDIAMLMSAVGNTEICQVVDPLRTGRFVMPKWVLSKYGFKL